MILKLQICLQFWNYKKKKSSAKTNFTQNYNKLEPLVRQDASEAKESVQDAKEFMEKVDKFFKMFSTAHDNYVRKLEEDTEEDDLENVLDTQFKYFDEVQSKFISVHFCQETL